MSKELAKFILAITFTVPFWGLVTPAFEFPDEQAHLGSVEYLRTQSEMPSYEKLDLSSEMIETQKYLGIFRNDLGQNKYTYHPEYHVDYSDSLIGPHEQEIKDLNTSESRTTYLGSEAAKYPPLYYRLIGFLSSPASSSNILDRLFSARLAGMIIILIMAYLVYLSGLTLFSSKLYARTLTLLVMLQPMYSFVINGVNSDNLHNLWFFALTYISLQLIKRGIRISDLLALATIIALDIYTKPQGFIAIPLVSLALLLSIIKFRKWKMLLAILGIGLVSLIFASPQWNIYRHLLNVANQSGVSFVEYLRFTANKLVAQNVVWYWGVFKWLGVVLPPIYWRIANRVVLLSVVGLVVYLYKVIKKKKIIADPYSVGYLLLVSLAYALIIFWYDWQHTKINGYSLGIQARYFFPTLLAHISLLMTGIISLGWSKISRRWLRVALVSLFVWLQLGGLYRLLSIYYDLSSMGSFILQVSQYKPDFLKGNIWYLWIALYLGSLIYLVKNLLFVGKVAKAKRNQK